MPILLVEHYLPLARALQRGLEEEGIATHVARDEVEAYARAHAAPYAAAVVDWRIPRKGGAALVRLWRHEGLTRPVLLLVPSAADADGQAALAAGADAAVPLPFSFAEVLARLRLGRTAGCRGPAVRTRRTVTCTIKRVPRTSTRATKGTGVTQTQRTLAGLMILGAAVVLAGCSKKSTPEPSAAPPGAEAGKGQFVDATGPHAAGKRVFATGGCTKCHTVGAGPAAAAPGPGQGPPAKKGWGGPKGMKRGPDLATVGRDPAHTVEWLMAYVRDPKSQNPKARMPAQTRLGDEDLRHVAEYLASLK